MKTHGGKAKKTDRARHAGSAETGHQRQISGCLQKFDPDPQRDVQKVKERDEQRIGRRPNEGSPTVFGAPIPILRRVEKPKRVMFGSAPVNLLSVNQPKLEEDERQETKGKVMALAGPAHRSRDQAGSFREVNGGRQARTSTLLGASSPRHDSAGRDSMMGEAQQSSEFSAADAVETNQHDRIRLVMRLQIKNGRIARDELLAALEADGDADRVWFGAGMAGANDEDFAIHLERRHPEVVTLFRARQFEPDLANVIECHPVSLQALVSPAWLSPRLSAAIKCRGRNASRGQSRARPGRCARPFLFQAGSWSIECKQDSSVTPVFPSLARARRLQA